MTRKPKGILFKGPMIRAILGNRKTVTRRLIKPQPLTACGDSVFFWKGKDDPKTHLWDVPRVAIERAAHYQPGDILYCKETHYRWGRWIKNGLTEKGSQAWRFKTVPYSGSGPGILWAADCLLPPLVKRTKVGWHKRPSIFMPKCPARIWLEVVSVRVEKLQEITEADAIAEGVERLDKPGFFKAYNCKEGFCTTAKRSYESLWNEINGSDSWDKSPFVWRIEFKRVERPE